MKAPTSTKHYDRGRGANTPWGKADFRTTYANGIDFYSTPGHGGFRLSAQRNEQIPQALRRDGGWYEEDVDAAAPLYFFSRELELSADEIARSVATLKDYLPYSWTRATGEDVAEEESYVLQRDNFQRRNRHKLIAVAAWGSYEDLPEGWVRVLATLGGIRGQQGTVWYVRKERYAARSRHGYVITEDDVYVGLDIR